jgi:hypothetical protein
MSHVVLLGDSIFDNDRYVPGGPSVIEHLRRSLPKNGRATLLARDGAVASEVMGQLEKLPRDTSHLIVSVGGNDALSQAVVILYEKAESFAEVLFQLGDIREQFQMTYRRMLQGVLQANKPTVVCTIYDAIPNLGRVEKTGLCLFNDVILLEAFRARVPVIDLRLLCTEPADYAPSSPIEPSVFGGGKIARAIARVVAGHDFSQAGTHVYS